jgi:hypothetical protein
MATRAPVASADLFVVLSPFSTLIPRLEIVLRPLLVLEDRVLGLEGYASASADAALVNLRLPRVIAERLGLDQILRAMAADGLRAVCPDRFSTGERRAFYLEYLASYDTYIQVYGAGRGLLLELVAALADHLRPQRIRRDRAGAPAPRRRERVARAESVTSH